MMTWWGRVPDKYILCFWHEDQVSGGLDLKSQFLMTNDVEGAEFQGCGIVLGFEGAQAFGVELSVENPLLFTEVEGGGSLAADQVGRVDF